MFECDVTIPGLGHYFVGAAVTIISDDVCEVDLLAILKYDTDNEAYVEHKPDQFEKELLERQVSINYFNQLH